MTQVEGVMNVELEISGGARLEVRHLRVVERVSELFEIRAEALSDDPSLDFESIVGRSAELRVRCDAPQADRSWKAVVARAEQARAVAHGHGGELSTYVFTLAPPLWLAQFRKNHRVFQHLSIPDIVDRVIAPYGVDPSWQIERANYPKLWLRVQYDESDLAFASRLLEEAGIAYAFIDGQMRLGDALSTAPFGDRGTLTSHLEVAAQTRTTPHAREVRLASEPRPGEHVTTDYDLRRPSFDLTTRASTTSSGARLEQYDYRPGGFLIEKDGADGQTPVADDKAHARHDQEFGTRRNQRALEADRTGRSFATFSSNQLGLAAGTTVTIEGHPNAAFGTKLLCVETRLETTTYPGVAIHHRAFFTSEPYRPARHTPKPKVVGVQSATVVGPPGDEIHTDEFGRVRVWFPWDREGERTDAALCWVRVAEGWSGAGFGIIALPRIGQEVLVSFLDGDPDQPVVVGRLHNELNPVPYRLPEFKTVSAWRTQSSPQNGGYNEMKLEDKAGKEFIYTRAQRDFHRLVLRDERTRVENKLHHTVVADEHRVSKAEAKELVLGNHHVHVHGDEREKIGASSSLTVGTTRDVKVGQKIAVEAGDEVHVKAGATIVIEAGARITLKAPGGFIDMSASGIDIVGELVRINSGGSAGTGSGCSPTAPDDAEEAQPSDLSID